MVGNKPMALQTLQQAAGNRLPHCSLGNVQVLLNQEKQREGRMDVQRCETAE